MQRLDSMLFWTKPRLDTQSLIANANHPGLHLDLLGLDDFLAVRQALEVFSHGFCLLSLKLNGHLIAAAKNLPSADACREHNTVDMTKASLPRLILGSFSRLALFTTFGLLYLRLASNLWLLECR